MRKNTKNIKKQEKSNVHAKMYEAERANCKRNSRNEQNIKKHQK
jgi:hypothetical protein